MPQEQGPDDRGMSRPLATPRRVWPSNQRAFLAAMEISAKRRRPRPQPTAGPLCIARRPVFEPLIRLLDQVFASRQTRAAHREVARHLLEKTTVGGRRRRRNPCRARAGSRPAVSGSRSMSSQMRAISACMRAVVTESLPPSSPITISGCRARRGERTALYSRNSPSAHSKIRSCPPPGFAYAPRYTTWRDWRIHYVRRRQRRAHVPLPARRADLGYLYRRMIPHFVASNAPSSRRISSASALGQTGRRGAVHVRFPRRFPAWIHPAAGPQAHYARRAGLGRPARPYAAMEVPGHRRPVRHEHDARARRCAAQRKASSPGAPTWRRTRTLRAQADGPARVLTCRKQKPPL